MNKMINYFEKLQVQQQELIVRLSQQTFEKNPLNRSHVVEVLKDIDGRDKMSCLYGISEKMLIVKQNTYDWIKTRKNAGMRLVEQLSDVDLARDIFKAWDIDNKGFLSLDELTDQLMSLGLCASRQFVVRLLQTLTKSGKQMELLTLKKFLKVFQYDKFGQSACKVLKEEFVTSQKRVYDNLKADFIKSRKKISQQQTKSKNTGWDGKSDYSLGQSSSKAGSFKSFVTKKTHSDGT